jgi:Helix-turn-helix domain
MAGLRSLVLVEAELLKLGLRPIRVGMGEVDVLENLTIAQHIQLQVALRRSGLELLESKIEVLVFRIKRVVMDLVYNEEPATQNLSVYLTTRLGYDYTYMSNLFSDVMHVTIEKFYICNKIERVKQLLLYEEFTLIEIARKVRFSSSAHLASQFKKVTGLTPSQFKRDNRDKHPERADCG